MGNSESADEYRPTNSASTDRLSTSKSEEAVDVAGDEPQVRDRARGTVGGQCVYVPKFNKAAFPPVAVVFTVKVLSQAKRAT